MSKWQDVKDFVNSNEKWTRKRIRKIVDKSNTIDIYVLIMMNAGFVKRIGKGKYKRLIKVPEYVSSSTMQAIAYNEEKRRKFMLTIIRKQKLKNIKINF